MHTHEGFEMAYEITFPDAEPMVQAERDQWPIRCYGLSLMDYRQGTVAERVTDEINREEWLESHQSSVDRLLAMVRTMGNVEGWQQSVLREAIHQIDRPNPRAVPRNTYRITVEYQLCPLHNTGLQGNSKYCPDCKGFYGSGNGGLYR
jgi:hypothetical protein